MNDAEALLSGDAGAIGRPLAMQVQPHYVGGTDVQPRYIGAPVQQVPHLNEGAVQYSNAAYVAGNLSFFGFGVTAIAAGATVELEFKPVRPITPQKLFIPSTVLGLQINSASIGGTNFFAGVTGVPCEIFSEVSTSKPLEWGTITPAVGVVLIVQNIDVVDRVFRGALYGTTVRT